MSSGLKPIQVYGQGGPNPPKVAMLLAELSLPYEFKPIAMSEVKKPAYLAVNPNGRLPSIHDPNTNTTLWESGAILLYLISRYDPSHKLSYAPDTPEAAHAQQWLFFQTTGQGPYFGQAAWFKKFHPTPNPDALERYVKEVNRVTDVLEGQLKRQKENFGEKAGGPWLVGDKYTYADLAFISWQLVIGKILEVGEYDVENYPEVKGWLGRMNAREAIKSVSLVPSG